MQCWGGNESGELGDGTTTERWTPVAVADMGSGVAAVSAGLGWRCTNIPKFHCYSVGHTCAVTTAGAVRCWGDNGAGQLGDGHDDQQLDPRRQW